MNIKIDNLGEFLKSKRKEKNLTIRCIACITNLSPGYISRIENGSSIPSYETLVKLSKALTFNLNSVIDTNLNIEETFDIIDVLSTFNLKLNNVDLSKTEKDIISSIINLIYDLSWDDDVEKIYGINRLLGLINDIKKYN